MRQIIPWIALNIFAAISKNVESAGTLEIELIKFSRLGRYCCEAPACGRCDAYFYFCITEYNSNRCTMPYTRTGRVDDKNNFYFSNERIKRDFSLTFTQASFGIRLLAYDHDFFNDDHIGTAHINIENVLPTPNGLEKQSKYVYRTLIANSRYQVEIRLRAYCAVDYYGSDCNTFCRNYVNGHYTCDEEQGSKVCDEGWTGEHCDTDIDECSTQNTCQNHGTCVNHIGTFNCNCLPGVRGIHCEHVYDHCRSNICRNGGTCSQDNGEVTCQCPLHWVGVRCEETVNPCGSNPCLNNASCDVTNDWPGYTCTCLHHWAGLNCSIKKAIEFLGDTYMITLNGVIDDTNRKQLDVGLKRLSRDLGKVYIKSLDNILQIKPGLKVTVVTFYMSRDNGPVKYDEIDSMFTNHTTGEINSYLPLPLYDHIDVFGDGSFSWNEILLIVVCVLILVVCLAAAAIFMVWRRRKMRRRNMKTKVKYDASPQRDDLIDLSIDDLKHIQVIEPNRGYNRYRHGNTSQSNDSNVVYEVPKPMEEAGSYVNSNTIRPESTSRRNNLYTDRDELGA